MSKSNISVDLSVRQFQYWNSVGLYVLVQKEILRFWSVSMQTVFTPVISTFLFYLVFSLAMGGDERVMNGLPYTQFVVPGLIMMNMSQNAFANSSSSLVIAKVQGNIVDVLMSPLSYAELFLGYVAGGVFRGMMIGIVCIILFAVLKGFIPQSIITLLVFGVMGTSMMAIMGIIGGIWADRFDNLAAFSNFFIIPLTFLSGTFFSLDQLSGIWRDIAFFNPFFHMIDGFRAGMTGVSETPILTSFIVLLITNIVLAFIALRILKTGYKLKS